MRDKILKFVKDYHAEKGYAPEQKEIAEGIGESKQLVNYHFHKMKNDLSGYPEYKRLFDSVKENE